MHQALVLLLLFVFYGMAAGNINALKKKINWSIFNPYGTFDFLFDEIQAFLKDIFSSFVKSAQPIIKTLPLVCKSFFLWNLQENNVLFLFPRYNEFTYQTLAHFSFYCENEQNWLYNCVFEEMPWKLSRNVVQSISTFLCK